MSILSILNIGVGALAAQQQSLQTTSHNIANVNTPGFSRQRVDLATVFPDVRPKFSLGRGVQAAGVRGVVDQFLETELLDLSTTVGFAEAQDRALTGIEDAFPLSAENGIGATLDSFFGSLSDLANNPASQAERINFIGRARVLGDTLRQTRATLTTLQSSLDKDLGGAVRRVNTLLPQIADLNRRVLLSETGQQKANDFRDQRRLLLQEVSRLTGATVLEGADGQVSVSLGGLPLVSGERAASLNDTNLNPSGFRLVYYQSPAGSSFDATTLFTKGEIGSLLAARDTTAPGFIGRLDQLAKSLVDTVNAQHALGFDLTGAAGGNFFTPIAAVAGAAAGVQVDSAVVANPNLIAAAQTAAGVPGDNRNALALVNLQTTPIAALGNLALKDYFLALAGDVGTRLRASRDSLDLQQTFLNQIQSRRDSVSGVNMDEEMSNLIQFQRAFEAASLLIRNGDELYKTVLDMVR